MDEWFGVFWFSSDSDSWLSSHYHYFNDHYDAAVLDSLYVDTGD